MKTKKVVGKIFDAINYSKKLKINSRVSYILRGAVVVIVPRLFLRKLPGLLYICRKEML